MFKYLQIRHCSTRVRSNVRNERLVKNYNFYNSFKYLTRSEKYEPLFNSPTAKQAFSKYGDELCTLYSKSKFSSFQNFKSLDLKSRIFLCDLVKTRFNDASLENRKKFKKFFDNFFRLSFDKILNEQLTSVDYTFPNNFLSSYEPEIFLKILFYYANHVARFEMKNNEITFFDNYLKTRTCLDYQYDREELTALISSLQKTYLRFDQTVVNELINQFLNYSYDDRLVLLGPFMKFIKQQDKFDQRLVDFCIEAILNYHHSLDTLVLILLFDTLSSIGHYDKKLIECYRTLIPTRFNISFYGLALFLNSYSVYGIDQNQDPDLFKFMFNYFKKNLNKYNAETFLKMEALKGLILCNAYDDAFFKQIFADETVRNDLQAVKFENANSDLSFVINSIEIEKPDLMTDYHIKNIKKFATPIEMKLEYELLERRSYGHFIKFLEANLNSKFDYEFIYPLEHVPISSLYLTYYEGRMKKAILIDLIDETNTFVNKPMYLRGLFRFKLRQMKAKGLKFVLYRMLDDYSFVKVG